MMQVTVTSTFTASQIAAKTMKNNGGQIIIIGSMDGVKPVPAPIHYAAAKGALISMTSAMAKEILDFEEFDITPRVIKKADKAWNHFQNNVKQDEAFELQKAEVEEFLGELKALFE